MDELNRSKRLNQLANSSTTTIPTCHCHYYYYHYHHTYNTIIIPMYSTINYYFILYYMHIHAYSFYYHLSEFRAVYRITLSNINTNSNDFDEILIKEIKVLVCRSLFLFFYQNRIKYFYIICDICFKITSQAINHLFMTIYF